MWRAVVLAGSVVAVLTIMAMPLGLRLVAWSAFTPDMVIVEVIGGERVHVPAVWLTGWPDIFVKANGDHEAALALRAANGRTVAECYALGLDPAEATNDFRIVSIEMVDGKPKVEWEPKVNRWTGAEILAVLKGAATLDGEWQSVEGATAAEKAAMRFFKVVVLQ